MRPISPELILSLSLPRLRALLDVFGAPPGIGKTSTQRAIALALFEGKHGERLARGLEAVACFASDPGRRAIVEAAHAQRDKRAASFLLERAADLAADRVIDRVVLEGKARRTAKRLLALATLRLERDLAERPTYALITDAPAPATPERAWTPKTVATALKTALGPFLHDVWAHAAADGVLHVAAFVSLPPATGLVLDDDALVAGTGAPVAVDMVHITPSAAPGASTRASITTAIPELLPRYAAALGMSLRPSFTLRPFHDLTPGALGSLALPSSVRGVTIVAIRWRFPEGTRQETRAFDALAALDHLNAVRRGYVDRVTVRVDVVDADRPVDAFLQLPHRLEISDARFEPQVRAALDAIGVFAPGALPDDVQSLAPFVHGEWRWRAVLSDEAFERLVRLGLLVRVDVPHVVSAEHRMLGATYVVREVPGEPTLEYALSEDRSFGARLVPPAARAAYRLELSALAARMRTQLGAVAVRDERAVKIEGMLDLGELALARGALRFLYAFSTLPKGWATAVGRACGVGVTPVVLVPKGRKPVAELLTIELDLGEQLGATSVARVVGRAALALSVEDVLEPWQLAAEDLVIERATQRAWVLGVLVPVADLSYRLLERVAMNKGRVESSMTIGSDLCASASSPDVAIRRAKVRLERQVRESLEEAGVDATIAERLIVTAGKNGYRLGVSARVL